MRYKKEGMPEEDELVLCTVTNVHHHSVFARMDEYDKTGMIHISEVSPGRIRNIRDYVVEGKKMVCKVLRIDRQKGHIDLSLRRVNEGQRRKKNEEIKQEQRAESIIEAYAKQNKLDPKEIYDKVSAAVFEKYEYIHECFNDIIEGKTSLEKLKVDPKIAKELEEQVKEKIKPPKVEISGELSLISYGPEGVEDVKAALAKIEKAKGDISVAYTGGGRYKVQVIAGNYKEAEKIMKTAIDSAIKVIEKKGGDGSFKRKEK